LGHAAITLCFGQPQRLSVDLDYNYVGHVERELMLEDRPRVEEAVAEVARRRGYAVQKSADAFAGRNWSRR
jgi:sRNA-binding protein